MRITKTKKFLSIFLIFIFLSSLIYLNFNLHYHELSNGSLLVHSHPFEKNHQPNSSKAHHYHSNIEFLTINLLSMVEIIILMICVLLFFKRLINYFINVTAECHYISPQLSFPAHRGPPSII